MLASDRGQDPTLGLAWRFARFGMQEQLRIVRRRLGLLRLQDLTEDADRVPDSPLAKAAFELAAGLSSPMLRNHAVRTYHFGAILAEREGLRLDRELLYVASVLHDLGLTPAHEAEPGSFEWVGARRARAFGIEQGMDPQRAHLLHDAIALHSPVGIASSREPEIAMVHYGAGLDLFGARLGEIPRLDLERLLEEWPRCGFKTEFPPASSARWSSSLAATSREPWGSVSPAGSAPPTLLNSRAPGGYPPSAAARPPRRTASRRIRRRL